MAFLKKYHIMIQINGLFKKVSYNDPNIYIALGEDNFDILSKGISVGTIIKSAIITNTIDSKKIQNSYSRLPEYITEKNTLINGEVMGFVLPKDNKKGFVLLRLAKESVLLPPPPPGFTGNVNSTINYNTDSGTYSNINSWGQAPQPPENNYP
jgi:hypothetical protein